MNRWIVLAGLLIGCFNLFCARPDRAPRPNIILILADDLGYSDLGCYGGEIATPNLDRMAAEGLRFTQFHNNAKCTETRAALLSGLYHHQTKNLEKPNHVTLAEVLKQSGYRTLMTGKWHLPKTPRERGFDRYFGFLVGAVDFFSGYQWNSSVNPMRLDDEVYAVPDSGFYTTDAFTDYAVEFMQESEQYDQPFFLYLAHNAPHFPLHAWPEDIAKYKDRYLEGWDKLRAERYARMLEMGLIKPEWSLTPRDSVVVAWDTLSRQKQVREAQLMAVYAAMVDRMDQNIGRVLDYLDESGRAGNTLIMFLSDNGACPWYATKTPGVPAGPGGTYITYDSEWANASNTPYRLYKQWNHQGGSATPFIVRWPDKIKDVGGFNRETGHLIDFMPTFLELAGAEYPASWPGRELLPMEGASLAGVMTRGEKRAQKPIFFEFRGNRAVREGKWKLVAERGMTWELYDLEADQTEMHNIIAEHPVRANRMIAEYEAWANRTGARDNAASVAMGHSKQRRMPPGE